MEALAAVSLAGNVAQFLEYAISAAQLAFQLVGEKNPLGQKDILDTVENTRDSLKLLENKEEIDAGVTNDVVLQDLVSKSLKTGAEIKVVLDTLEAKGRGSWDLWEGLQKTGYLIYKGKDLQRLSERLFKLRSEVSSHLLVLMEYVHHFALFPSKFIRQLTERQASAKIHPGNSCILLGYKQCISRAIWQASRRFAQLSQEHFEEDRCSDSL